MLTASAARSLDRDRLDSVTTTRELMAAGWTPDQVRAQLDAGRWQRIGRAILLHNGPPSRAEVMRAAVIVLGPRAVLTAFSALEVWGLRGWEREPVHVLVPRGARVTRPAGLPLRVHYTADWRPSSMNLGRRLHRPGPAAILAGSTMAGPRAACGILAATVQQRLTRPSELAPLVAATTRVRHRAHMLAAAHDIAQGAQALSEIDFARLCRSAGLPPPVRQVVRRDKFGRRRYLDAEWIRAHGEHVVVEVDGALHLIVGTWWGDQIRQNELVISGDKVLRFPSAVVRTEPSIVIDQLGRMLAG